MSARNAFLPIGLVLVLSFCFTSLASAQYFDRAEPGYLPPEPAQSRDLTLSRAGSESGFYTQGPPPVRIGGTIDFGLGGLRNNKLDSDFFAMNDSPLIGAPMSLTFDVGFLVQAMDTFRVGLTLGRTNGGRSSRNIDLLRIGLNLEAGRRFYTGWGIWAGGNIGWGRGTATSRDVYADEFYYEAKGLGIRGFVRFEREIAPFLTFRLTPYVETLVRTDEFYQEDVLASRPPSHFPGDTRGTFLGYGAMIGLAFHTF